MIVSWMSSLFLFVNLPVDEAEGGRTLGPGRAGDEPVVGQTATVLHDAFVAEQALVLRRHLGDA